MSYWQLNVSFHFINDCFTVFCVSFRFENGVNFSCNVLFFVYFFFFLCRAIQQWLIPLVKVLLYS